MTTKDNTPISTPLAKSAMIILYPQFSKQLIRTGHDGNVNAKKSSRTANPRNPTTIMYTMLTINAYLMIFLDITSLWNKQKIF